MGDTAMPEYERLAARVEQTLELPAERPHLADAMFALAQRRLLRNQPEVRLQAILQAVKLDPFRRRFRVALARVERELGLVEEAIAELQAFEKEGGTLDDEARLELGQALLEVGKLKEARTCLEAISPGHARAQAHFDLIECGLLSAASPEDWQGLKRELLDEELLRGVNCDSPAVGIWSEKCLKFAIECDDSNLLGQLVEAAEQKAAKLGFGEGNRPPAYELFLKVARYQPEAARASSHQLEDLLLALRLTRRKPLTGAIEARLEAIKTWRTLVADQGDTWFGLRDAYLHVLDGWAAEAYAQKEFPVARSLWGEAERVAPGNPQVLKDLAIVSTRMGDEVDYAWYWDQVVKVWNFHSELVPEADGYAKALLQKSQAFADGAEKKLAGARGLEETLATAAIWAREAVTFLVLRQLAFRSAFLRCGILTEDFANETERDDLLLVGHGSASLALKLVGEWQQLGDQSELGRHRQAQLDEALRLASTPGSERYRSYDQEREAFLSHRKQAAHSLLQLLGILRSVGNEADFADEKAHRELFVLARCALAFPHRLLKPEVLGLAKGLDETVEIRELASNHALGPWLGRAQRLLRSGEGDQAAELLAEALAIDPESAVARFLLAQCHASAKRFQQAYDVLVEAQKYAAKGELHEQIDGFADQMDVARLDQALEKAKALLKKDDPAGAVRECQVLVQKLGDRPYLLFMLGRAYAANLDFDEAKASLRKARAARPAREKDELGEAIDAALADLQESAPLMVLSRAVPLMKQQKWGPAREALAKGRRLEPRDPRVTFYEAVCLAHLNDTDEAEKVAKAALALCQSARPPGKPGTGGTRAAAPAQEIRALIEEIESFLPQIAVIPIAEELSVAQEAMGMQQWSTALQQLDGALKKRPQAVRALFLKAVCHFRAEQWDDAEKTAQRALPLSGPHDKDLREQLELLLRQVPMARIAKDMEAINQSMKGQRWRDALQRLELVLQAQPTQPVCLFYRAVCLMRLERWDEAEEAIRKASPHCSETEQKDIRDQLEIVATNIDRGRRAARSKPVIEAMNRGRYEEALSLVDRLLNEDPPPSARRALEVPKPLPPPPRAGGGSPFRSLLSDPIELPPWAEPVAARISMAPGLHPANDELRFLRAVCLFKSVMESINSRGERPSQSMFDPVDEALRQAQWISDPEISSQVQALKKNVEAVRQQLRTMGIY
jgi:tetratricopeptide (TPR) repeat protein